MKIYLTAGAKLEGTDCTIKRIYPRFIVCETPEGREVSFNFGDIVSKQFDTRPIWEQEDDFLLDCDFCRPYRVE